MNREFSSSAEFLFIGKTESPAAPCRLASGQSCHPARPLEGHEAHEAQRQQSAEHWQELGIFSCINKGT